MLGEWFAKVVVSKDQEQKTMENWFANSVDLADLERRQRMVEHGQAPWQIRAKGNLQVQGWSNIVGDPDHSYFKEILEKKKGGK